MQIDVYKAFFSTSQNTPIDGSGGSEMWKVLSSMESWQLPVPLLKIARFELQPKCKAKFWAKEKKISDFPTGPFKISEPRDKEIGKFYVVQKRCLTDIEALKLLKVGQPAEHFTILEPQDSLSLILLRNLPDEHFHNFRASRSGDWRALCSAGTPWDGF